MRRIFIKYLVVLPTAASFISFIVLAVIKIVEFLRRKEKEKKEKDSQRERPIQQRERLGKEKDHKDYFR